MKLIVLTAVILMLLAFSAKENPLKNTRWRADNFVLVYGTTDTLDILMDDEKVLTAIYQVKDSLLSLKEIEVSQMSCDPTIEGKYSFRITGDKLKFTLIDDKCQGRSQGLGTAVFTKEVKK